MFMKTKFLKLFALSLAPVSVLTTLSCKNTKGMEALDSLVDHKTRVEVKEDDKRAKQTEEWLNSLLKTYVYKNNQIELDKYVFSQTDVDEVEKIKAELNKMKQQYELYFPDAQIAKLQNQLDEATKLNVFLSGAELEKNKQKIAELQNQINSLQNPSDILGTPITRESFAVNRFQFFQKNWLFVLKNLNLFNWTFAEWFTNPLNSDGIKPSEEYLNNLKTLKPYSPYSVTDNYLDELIIGQESSELPNAVAIYIRKGKLIFRFIIENIEPDQIGKVNLKPLNYYFGASKANVISLNQISNIIHQGYIHENRSQIDELENKLIKEGRYGEPAMVFPIIK
ncbi:hypothetical protein FG904_00580 [Mycoplasma nasistruthionis]|uniref:Lipoprotein n=2 Tax=Mycoplasma nasistruthionis TaxID=353852 RepID=A0A5B7XV08_9MOLU|nr:hypothetical protein FG904_00580 [Mycoplasma nasistruthionis]